MLGRNSKLYQLLPMFMSCDGCIPDLLTLQIFSIEFKQDSNGFRCETSGCVYFAAQCINGCGEIFNIFSLNSDSSWGSLDFENDPLFCEVEGCEEYPPDLAASFNDDYQVRLCYEHLKERQGR